MYNRYTELFTSLIPKYNTIHPYGSGLVNMQVLYQSLGTIFAGGTLGIVYALARIIPDKNIQMYNTV